MKYNEKTGEFERTASERVGYYAGRVGYGIGYVGWWVWKCAVIMVKIAVVLAVAKLVWRMVG